MKRDGWISAADFRQQPVDGAQVRKYFVAQQIEPIADSRRIKFIISDGSIDRDNDIIDPNGWDLVNFKANPVVLFAHSHRDLPIGKAVEIGVEAGKLVAVAEFATHPFAETVLQLLKGGFMRATSVGFRALEFSINEERRGIDFKRQELLEFSVVPVPANANALIAASTADIELEPLRKWMADLLTDWPGELKLPGTAWEKVLGAAAKHAGAARTDREATGEAEFAHLHAAVMKLNARLAKLDPIDPRGADDEKGVSPRDVNADVAARDATWSAPGLSDFTSEPWGDLTATTRRRIAGHYAWAAAMPPAAFADLKLPHHQPSDGKVVFRGIAAAAGRLNQASIPDGDMGAVKSHLRRHYAQFDAPVPDVLRESAPATLRELAQTTVADALAVRCAMALEAESEAVFN